MKLGIFTVYDSAAEVYLEPFVVLSKGVALRTFVDLVNKPGHQFNAHSSDYTLFQLGEFDQVSGEFDTYPPVSLGNGVEFREATE